MQYQIIFSKSKYPTGFDKVVSSGMFSSYFFQINFLWWKIKNKIKKRTCALTTEYLMEPARIINIILFINNLINICWQAVTGVNVKIISHARGSSHEKATQDGLRFCTLYESLLPRGDCMLPISSCLVQDRKNISPLVSFMVIKVILIKWNQETIRN